MHASSCDLYRHTCLLDVSYAHHSPYALLVLLEAHKRLAATLFPHHFLLPQSVTPHPRRRPAAAVARYTLTHIHYFLAAYLYLF